MKKEYTSPTAKNILLSLEFETMLGGGSNIATDPEDVNAMTNKQQSGSSLWDNWND